MCVLVTSPHLLGVMLKQEQRTCSQLYLVPILINCKPVFNIDFSAHCKIRGC